MNRQPLAVAISAALLVWGPAALAQTSVPSSPAAAPLPPVSTGTASSSGFEASGIPSSGAYAPKSMRLMDGGVYVTPTVGVSVGRNDNVSLSDTNTTSSSFYTVAPKILGSAAYKADRYTFGYQGEIIRFSSSSKDNVENHELAVSGLNVLDTRFAINWRGSYQDRYDAAGTTDRTSATGRPDHWRGTTAVVAGRYGAPGAQGRVELEAGFFDKEYVNNRATTVDADYKSTNVAARFGVRIAPKTTGLIEYRNTRFDYQRDVQNLDNTEQRLLAGVEWEATAATSGTFKAGYLNKQFKRGRSDFSGLTWEGGVTWAPLTYSTLQFSTGRSASDPSGTSGNFVLGQFYSANWTHQWRTFLSTRVSYSHNQAKYDGTSRKDKTDALGLAVNYDFRQWVRLGAEYQYSQRNSNAAGFDYNRNLYTLFAEFSF